MKKSSSLKNIFWNFVGLSFYGIASLFYLLIVKSINGIDASGIFSYSYSLCTLFFYIALFYNRTFQISNNINLKFNDYLSSRFIYCFLSLAFITFYTIFTTSNITKILVVVLLMLFRIMDAISDTFYALFQTSDRLDIVGKSYTFKSIVSILIFLVIDLVTCNLVASCLGIVICNLFFLIFYDLKQFKKNYGETKIELSLKNFKLITFESSYIFVFSFMAVFLSNAQKYILEYYALDSIQGVFAILIMPATVLSLISGYILNPFLNELKKLCSTKKYKQYFNYTLRILLYIVVVGTLGTIFCYFFGTEILSFIYGENLITYKLDLSLVILGATFNALAVTISSFLILLNHNKEQVYFYAVAIVVAVLYCVLFYNANNYIRISILSYLFSYFILLMIFLMSYFYIVKKLVKKGDCYEKQKSKSKHCNSLL